MAMHYGVGVVPARPYRTRDKTKVEVGVQVAKRWIIAALRHQNGMVFATPAGSHQGQGQPLSTLENSTIVERTSAT